MQLLGEFKRMRRQVLNTVMLLNRSLMPSQKAVRLNPLYLKRHAARDGGGSLSFTVSG